MLLRVVFAGVAPELAQICCVGMYSSALSFCNLRHKLCSSLCFLLIPALIKTKHHFFVFFYDLQYHFIYNTSSVSLLLC